MYVKLLRRRKIPFDLTLKESQFMAKPGDQESQIFCQVIQLELIISQSSILLN